jgi:hypothetical protein
MGSFVVLVQDAAGPFFANVPEALSAFASSAAGAEVDYASPTASDAVDGEVPVTCTPASGTLFPPNQTEVLCTASDSDGNVSEVTFPATVTFDAPTDTSFFMAPFSGDGTVIRLNQTIQVRFRLRGESADISDVIAGFKATRISGAGAPVVAEEGSFAKQANAYRYTWRPRSLTRGEYVLSADLGDGVVHEIQVSLR